MTERQCPLGLTRDELEERIGYAPDVRQFDHWMRGQTMAICDGSQLNPAPKCAERPHGVVVYEWDLERFLLGLPVVD